MPGGRFRGDDDWSFDDDDDYRYREIARKVSRSHSRRGRRSPSPVINVIENRLFVPGQGERRGSSRSRSRHRSSSDERERMERRMAQLAVSRDEGRSYEDREEDIRRRIKQEMRDREYEKEEARKRLEWDMEDLKRKDEKKRKDYEREAKEAEERREDELDKYRRELADKERKDKENKEKIIAEMKAAEEKAKKEEERIVAEAALKKKQKEEDDKALKEKILREVELEKQEKKDKEKKEEEAFIERIRSRAIAAGMDPDRAVAQFRDRSPENNKQLLPARQYGKGLRRRVKVRKEHISPEILDTYNLRWNWYDGDRTIILIEDEVDDEFIYELQTVTADRYKSRKLITPGYTKETVTTLMPGGSRDAIRKKNGKYYMVRKRSVSRNRHPSLSDLF